MSDFEPGSSAPAAVSGTIRAACRGIPAAKRGMTDGRIVGYVARAAGALPGP